MKKIKVFEKSEAVDGFATKKGFAALIEDGKIVAITSGYENNGELFVYRPVEGEWKGSWECQDCFPVAEVLEEIQNFQDGEETRKALKYLEGKKAKASSEPLTFVDVVAGEKSNNGGEYGFYTTYYPTEHAGVYRVWTHTTCDFDPCGTGYEGIRALTMSEYRRLRRESDKVEAAGSLY